MITRIILLSAMLCSMSGCVVSPRIELAETINFDAPMPDQTPMSYDDMLCCYRCNV